MQENGQTDVVLLIEGRRYKLYIHFMVLLEAFKDACFTVSEDQQRK